MDFALFILLNAVLLIRPEEIMPDLAGLRIYLMVMAACLLANAPRLIAILNPAELASRPITLCVVGFWLCCMRRPAAFFLPRSDYPQSWAGLKSGEVELECVDIVYGNFVLRVVSLHPLHDVAVEFDHMQVLQLAQQGLGQRAQARADFDHEIVNFRANGSHAARP